MAEQDTFKEFLVALGFKVDDASYKKFFDNVAGATKSVNLLGIVTGLTESAIVTMVAKTAEAMEKLYFASARTGSAIASMKAFDFAVSNLGGSAEEAQAAIESLGKFSKTYGAGADQFLVGIGVDPAHVHDSAKALDDLAVVFQRLKSEGKEQLGLQEANFLGIPYNVFIAMENGEFSKALDQYNQRLAATGTNYTEAGERGHAFMTELRTVGAGFESLGVAIEDKLALPLRDVLSVIDLVVFGLTKIINSPIDAFNSAVKGVGLAITNPQQAGQNVMAALGYNVPKAPGTGWAELAGSAIAGKFGQTTAYFMKQGWRLEEAEAIAANIQRESNFDPTAKGDNGQAYGIAQWHKPRRDAFKKWAGHDIYGSSMEEQLAFIQHELTSGDYWKTGAYLHNNGRTLYDKTKIVSDMFEQPADKINEPRIRGAIAEKGAAAIDASMKIDMHITGSGDPQQTAGAIGTAMGQIYKDHVRNIAGAVQ